MRRALATTIGAAIMAASALRAGAATPLLIAPTIVEIAPQRRSASIEVTNQSDAPVDLQVRGYDWSQPDGRDRLDASAAIVISPAIVTIPARGKQLFRVLVADPRRDEELAFRLRINELPRPGDAGTIAVNLEFLVPVFRQGGKGVSELRWRRTPAGIEIDNRGTRHAKLLEAAMIAPDGRRTPIAAARSAYLLAGSRRIFPAAPGVAGRMQAVTDTGPLDVVASDPAP